MIHYKVVKSKKNPETFDIILAERKFFMDKPLSLIEEGLTDAKGAEYFTNKLNDSFRIYEMINNRR